MRFRRQLLRDVFVLTLPLTALLGYILFASVVSFWRAEVECFHGYPVRGLRIGGYKAALDAALEPVLGAPARRYLPDIGRRTDGPRMFDVRVDGLELDALRRDLPGSVKEWVSAMLFEPGGPVRVELRNRGQRMVNWFWEQKAWKIRTPQRELVDGYRDIGLTPLLGRLDSHLTFLLAERMGIPTSRSRIVQLFVNLEDQGLYIQEEQIDESMIRRLGRMPGDVFYGEQFVPDEPTMSSDGLFWNPFSWRKSEVHNWFGEEHRPHLAALLDAVTSDELESWDALYELFDLDALVGYFALLTFQGDQHVDHHHNHKLYFSPIDGRFVPLVWNPLLNMPIGFGVESKANRLFEKLCRDPLFLDRVHARVHEFVTAAGTELQLEELDRIGREYRELALDPVRFDTVLGALANRVRARGETVRRQHADAAVHWQARRRDGEVALDLWARGVASLRLDEIRFEHGVSDMELWEDRDFDGAIGPTDRRLETRVDGDRLVVDGGAQLAVGRDFRATYLADTLGGSESLAVHREYTRLAALKSPFLLKSSGSPEITGLGVSRTVGTEEVAVAQGAPEGYVATRTVHPWRMPPPAAPARIRFEGVNELTEDVLVPEGGTLEVVPGAVLRLGPDVSIVSRARVELRGVTIERLEPSRPWGVVALHGPAASDSVVAECTMTGGSHAVVRHVYYSGMLSVHGADRVAIHDCKFGPNVLGDDTVRYAECEGVSIRDVRIDRANGDAIDCDLSTGQIERVWITDSRNDGIDLMTADVAVHGCRVERAGDKGISFGEGANPLVTDSIIEGCILGLGLKDGSDPILRGVTLRGCRVAIAGYDKNWRYAGGGRGRLIDCALIANETDVRLDASSSVILVESGAPEVVDVPDPALVEVLTAAEARARAPSDRRIAELLEARAP